MPVSAREPRLAERRPRFGGLDGLRAIAVTMVLVYHLFPGALPGGFLGVDIFFVISGFLISSLLLSEIDDHGRIRLLEFWRRRARRLLPALGLVVLASTSLALAVGGDALVRIGSQITGTAFFVNNWVLVAHGSDYFARDTPELFRNTWSLSIEEQFYLLLPLILLLVSRVGRRSVRTMVFLLLGTASALWMVELSLAQAAPTRIYFGSDSHTFGLLLGVALACLVHRASPAPVPGRAQQRVFTAVTVAGLAVLGALSLTLAEGSALSFEGGFQLATAASLAVVWAITRTGSRVGAALDIAPLRWIGERSYGLYLWHWPLLVIIDAALDPTPLPDWLIGTLTLALTSAVAAISYRAIEQPVRRIGLRRSLKLMFGPSTHSSRQRLVAVTIGALLIVGIPATGVAVAVAPSASSAELAVERGAQHREGASPTPPPTQTPSPTPQPEAPAATGSDITAIGDSVMLASLPELTKNFPGIEVDADVSRGLGVGVQIAGEQSNSGRLRSIVIVGLGTNGPVQVDDLDALRKVAGTRPIVLVNAHGERDWIPEVNEVLAEFAEAHRGVVVADWDRTVPEEALAGDGIHPHPAGGEVYADAVQRALDELAEPGEAIGYGAPRL